MFSLPVDFPGDDGEVFRSCVDWVARRFGDGCILSADVHRDESAPHCHVLMLPPIDGGTMRGSDAVALARSAQTRQSLGREVARKFGLSMGAGKLVGKRKHGAATMVLGIMEAAIAGAVSPALWAAIKDAVMRDPGPFIDALGLDAPGRELKSFTAIMTSQGKGPRKERDTQSPLGFAAGAGEWTPRHAGDGESPLGFAGGVPAAGAGGESPLGFGSAGDLEKSEAKKAKPNLCLGFDDKPAFPDGRQDHGMSQNHGKGHDQAGALQGDARRKAGPLAVAADRTGRDHGDMPVQAVADGGVHADQPGDWVRVHDAQGDPWGLSDADDMRGHDDAQGDMGADDGGDQVPAMPETFHAGRAAGIRGDGSMMERAQDGQEPPWLEGGDVVRVRDADIVAGLWDADAGEFVKPFRLQRGGGMMA
jgi:hypothetical protein